MAWGVLSGRKDIAVEGYIHSRRRRKASVVNGKRKDLFILLHSYQDPSSTALVLELRDALTRDPEAKCIEVIQSGGDKVVGKLLGIRRGECGTEFGCEALRGGLACLMWASKVKWTSNLTPRLVTNEERGMSWPENAMQCCPSTPLSPPARQWACIVTMLIGVSVFVHSCVSSA